MTYARKIAVEFINHWKEVGDGGTTRYRRFLQLDYADVEAVINEVIEACAQEAEGGCEHERATPGHICTKLACGSPARIRSLAGKETL